MSWLWTELDKVSVFTIIGWCVVALVCLMWLKRAYKHSVSALISHQQAQISRKKAQDYAKRAEKTLAIAKQIREKK